MPRSLYSVHISIPKMLWVLVVNGLQLSSSLENHYCLIGSCVPGEVVPWKWWLIFINLVTRMYKSPSHSHICLKVASALWCNLCSRAPPQDQSEIVSGLDQSLIDSFPCPVPLPSISFSWGHFLNKVFAKKKKKFTSQGLLLKYPI